MLCGVPEKSLLLFWGALAIPIADNTHHNHESLTINIILMKPFFSPLVREKVKAYYDNNELTKLYTYVEKYLSLWSQENHIDATGCVEEVTYLLTSVIDEVVTIQRYTTLNHSHILTLFYSLKQRMECAIYPSEREFVVTDEIMLILAFDIAECLLSVRFREFKCTYYNIDYVAKACAKYKVRRLFDIEFALNYHNDLIQSALESIDFILQASSIFDEVSDSDEIARFILEEKLLKEQKSQSKKNNVVTWDALIDSLQTVDKEHLDAFHSYFTRVATKYTQDNDKLRNNLDKLTTQIEQCKVKHASIVHKTYKIDKVDQFVDTIQEQTIQQ
jgi:hypothetical protein